MERFIHILIVLCCLFLTKFTSYAQEGNTAYDKAVQFPDKLFGKMNNRAASMNARLDKQTQRYLDKMMRQEKKLRTKIARKDSSLAKQLFDESDKKYQKLKNAPAHITNQGSVYSGRLDSVTTSLKLLKSDNVNNLGNNAALQKTLGSYQQLQAQLDASEQAKKFMQQRQEQLKEQLQKLGMTKELQQLKKQVALYQSQVQEYKNMLDDPSKMEGKLISLAQKVPAWKNFFARNSLLGSLFSLPGAQEPNAPLAPGLQTRAMVTQNLVGRFGSMSAVNQVLQQNVPAAQNQLQQLKDKLNKYTNGSAGNGSGSSSDMPDYKVNQQRSKSFWRRLEWGASMQTQKAYAVLPVTSDIGLSVGFRISDKQTIGVGLAEKIGFGHGWQHLKISQQGANIRSFLDVKLKGSIWITGGYELNYRPALAVLDSASSAHNIDLKYWQRSGVIGLSKNVTIKSKVAKKAKIQVLWDYLSYSQQPRTPAIIWRVLYAWK